MNWITRQRTYTPAFHGPTVWSSLPSAVRDSSLSLNTFKRRLKTHLFGQSWMPPGAVVAFCDSGAGYKCHVLLTYLLTYLLIYSERSLCMLGNECDTDGRPMYHTTASWFWDSGGQEQTGEIHKGWESPGKRRRERPSTVSNVWARRNAFTWMRIESRSTSVVSQYKHWGWSWFVSRQSA